MATPEWLAPTFTQGFTGVRCRQGGDAHFAATVAAKPTPSEPPCWSKDGLTLSLDDQKYVQVRKFTLHFHLMYEKHHMCLVKVLKIQYDIHICVHREDSMYLIISWY
jgi:hypothetical protein